ncbi:luciferase family protein [Pedobacter agri]|uniref:luciferase domain-containing protein n=1 Tax=Pedobacter agri TaxID=454586 RepID=UPI00292D2200|nr:luciferase family protein [Pedobacter agri]
MLALVYDSLLKLHLIVFQPEKLNWFDELEEEISKWEGTTIQLHKFGGTQFNFQHKELGHLHSNGVLDILFNRKLKAELIADGRASEHHVFIKSGWVSFQIKAHADVKKALELMQLAYQRTHK